MTRNFQDMENFHAGTGPEMFYGNYWNQRPPLEDEEFISHPTPRLNEQNYSDPSARYLN